MDDGLNFKERISFVSLKTLGPPFAIRIKSGSTELLVENYYFYILTLSSILCCYEPHIFVLKVLFSMLFSFDFADTNRPKTYAVRRKWEAVLSSLTMHYC